MSNENIKKIQDSIKAQNLSYKINVAGILYILNENNNGMSPAAYTASYDKNRYPTYGDTDDEEDTDDETNQLGGNKKNRRKRTSRHSTKRETRRRRKSIKRRKSMRKKTRKFK